MTVRLFIAVPSGDHWHADMALAFTNMVLYLQKEGVEFVYYNVRSSILPDSRNKLALLALEVEATHLLFIDSDMTFPRDTALRLLKHPVDIVAANCVTRSRPANTTARIDGKPYYPTSASGLKEVHFIGTGIMMIKTEVFKNLEMPYFMNKWSDEREQVVGEDWYFIEKAREKGFKVFIDDELSWQIRHLGIYPYGFDDVDYPPDKRDQLREYLTNAARKSG